MNFELKHAIFPFSLRVMDLVITFSVLSLCTLFCVAKSFCSIMNSFSIVARIRLNKSDIGFRTVFQ